MLGDYKKAYAKLYSTVYGEGHRKYIDKDVSSFVAMQGSEYYQQKNVRLMLVGRATNGWGKTLPVDSEEKFANEAVSVFQATDRFQTEWKMQNCLNNPYSEYKDGNGEWKKYYLSGSSFWNYTKDIWCKLNGVEDKPNWYEDIVWNNIYKIAPTDSGNPSTNLIYAQAEACVDILKSEIDILKPTHILLVIDDSWISWTSRKTVMFDFMQVFEGYEDCSDSIPENQQMVQRALQSGDVKVLVTCRPENVGKTEYVTAVLETFENMNK